VSYRSIGDVFYSLKFTIDYLKSVKLKINLVDRINILKLQENAW